MKNSYGKKSIIATVIVALGVSGCATPNGGSSGDAGEASCLAATLGGALLGGLLVGGNGRNVATGAAVGAALGALACVVVKSQSRQVRTAEAVEHEYQSTQGRLPAQPSVVRYSTSVNPAQAIRAGSEVQVRSTIEVVPGTNRRAQTVKEELFLLNPDGKEFRRSTKLVNDNTPAAGQFENSFTFKLPSGAPQGIYTARTALYLDNQLVRQEDTRIQLVQQDGVTGVRLAAR